MLEEKVVELSKIKIILLIFGAVGFVVLGVWFLSMGAHVIQNRKIFNNTFMVYGIGVITIVFFGLCGFIGLMKLFDSSPGLIISTEGIVDNSSGVSAGLISWSEVVGIGEYEIQNQKFISIQIKDPERYAVNGNAIKRMAHRANIKMCGTPINISANSLKISYEELLGTIIEYYRESLEKA